MKLIAGFFLSLFLVGALADDPSAYLKKQCILAGVKAVYVPYILPSYSKEVDKVCGKNKCCSTDYFGKVDQSARGVFKECLNDTFTDLIYLANDFFDDFTGLFGVLTKNALFSSFAQDVGFIHRCDLYYIDYELIHLSRLLAEITFKHLRGEIDDYEFKEALRDYACGFLSYHVQQKYFKHTLYKGRINGACLCNLKVPFTDIRIGDKVFEIIADRVSSFLRVINNIRRLILAIQKLRIATIKNLEAARNFKPSPLCVRKFLNSVACQHCKANATLACPNSCRLVTLFCLEPLRKSFDPPFREFIRIVRLSLRTLLGHYSKDYSLWNVKRIAAGLLWGVKSLDRKALNALAYSVKIGRTVEDSLCFIQRKHEPHLYKCNNATSNSDIDCTRTDSGTDSVSKRSIRGARSDSDSSSSDSDNEDDYDRYYHNIDADTSSSDSDSDTDKRGSDKRGSGSDSDKRGSGSGSDKRGSSSGSGSGSDTDTDSDTDSDEEKERVYASASTSASADSSSAGILLRKFILKLLARFNEFSSFRQIASRIVSCVCQPYGSCTTSDCAYAPGRNRLATLRIGYFPHCHQRYLTDVMDTSPITANPVYQELTYAEKKEYDDFAAEVAENFTPMGEGPELAHLISDITSGQEDSQNSAGIASFSFILGVISAFVALVFVLF